MLPIGDYPNPPKPQWATRILIGINVAIHLFFTMPMEQQQLTDEERAAARKQIQAQTDQQAAGVLTAEQYESWTEYRARSNQRASRFGRRQ